MLFNLAAGIRIDEKRSERFKKQIERIYEDPFAKAKKKELPKTRDEIVDYIYRKVEEAKAWT